MIVPSPFQYLASYAITFVAGAVSIAALYGKRHRAAGTRDAASGTH